MMFQPRDTKIVDIHKKRIQDLIITGLNGKHILDVGCGQGDFLQCTKDQNYIPYGVDISKTVVRNLRRRGIAAYISLSRLKIKFNAITAFDVIEHTTDPNEFIRKIIKNLKEKGLFMVTTPNIGGISGTLLKDKWWVLGPEGHYVLFNVESLTFLLKKNGFKIKMVSTDMITQWLTPNNNLFTKLINKFVYVLLFPFNQLLFQHNLGDNIQIICQFG